MTTSMNNYRHLQHNVTTLRMVDMDGLLYSRRLPSPFPLLGAILAGIHFNVSCMSYWIYIAYAFRLGEYIKT